MTQVIGEVLPGRPAVALSGPEPRPRDHVGPGRRERDRDRGPLGRRPRSRAALARGVFRLYTNHDVIGAEVGGALKNVVALATGMAQGLGVGRQHARHGHRTGTRRDHAARRRDGRRAGDVRGPRRPRRPRRDVCQPALTQPHGRRGARQGPLARRDPREHEHGRRGCADRDRPRWSSPRATASRCRSPTRSRSRRRRQGHRRSTRTAACCAGPPATRTTPSSRQLTRPVLGAASNEPAGQRGRSPSTVTRSMRRCWPAKSGTA